MAAFAARCRVCHAAFGAEHKRHCPNPSCDWCQRCYAAKLAECKAGQ